MTRSKAMRLIYLKLNAIGLNNEDLHEILNKMCRAGEIKHASLSASSGFELHKIIKVIFSTDVFVEDSPIIKRILREMREYPECIPHIYKILERYKKKTIYQLSPKQCGFVLGYVLKNKEEKCN